MNNITSTALEGFIIARDFALENVIGLSEKDIFGYDADAAAINVKVQFTDMAGNLKVVTVNTLKKEFVICRDDV